jgi:uncharacterized GH25 family protein
MRPFLVLILVLAALAALLFGVLSFLKEAPPKPADVVPTVSQNSEPAGSGSTPSLEGVPRQAEDRSASPVDPEDSRTTATGDGRSYQYENTLNGVVQNPQGQPLAGCDVALSTYVELIFVGDPIDTTQDRSTRTNADGRFAFTNLEPRDSYKLTVKHKDFTLKEIQSIPVGEKGEFEEPPILLSNGATMQGYVKDDAGNNVDGATLVLDGLVYQGASYAPPDRMVVNTDVRGWYTFTNVPPGQRTVAVTAPGYGMVTLQSLVFTKDEVVAKDFKLSVGEMIRGRVVCQGQGIPDATVQAFSLANTNAISRGQTTTDASGEFTLESLAPGEYNLLAGARGYRSEGNVTRQRTGSDNVIIEVTKEADVCGRVIDNASGSPLSSFTCRLRVNNGPGVATSVTEFTGTFNDPRGEFCLTGIPAGSYVIEASAPGYAPTFSAPVNVNRGQAPSGNVVRLTKGGSISGRVVDAAGKPVSRARITTHDKDWSDDAFSQMLGSSFPSNVTQVDVRCGDDGRFLLKGMTPEIYQLNVRAPGFTRWIRTDVLVAEGEETNLGDIRLAAGGTIRGVLFDAAGRPLVGGSIQVVCDDGREGIGYSTKSGSDGKFQILNVSPGQYQISAARLNSADGTPFDRFLDSKNSRKALTVTDGTTQVVELTLSP